MLSLVRITSDGTTLSVRLLLRVFLDDHLFPNVSCLLYIKTKIHLDTGVHLGSTNGSVRIPNTSTKQNRLPVPLYSGEEGSAKEREGV